MTIEQLNKLCKETFIGYLDIEFLSYGENFIEARMPVNSTKLQPMGLLHGGASLALAETVASGGSFMLIDDKKYNVLGLQVTGNHVGTMSQGDLIARGELLHKGKITHIWDVKITTADTNLICVARVTNIIIEKKQEM